MDSLVRIAQDVYAITERIEFDDTEITRGKSDCATAVATDGFFSLSQLHLVDSATMNDSRMTEGALRRVFFQRFLSDDFDLHGQIVCAKGESIDAQMTELFIIWMNVVILKMALLTSWKIPLILQSDGI